VIEVVPEPPRADGLSEVGIRGTDDADVDRLGLGAAEAADGTSLEDGEELGLDRYGQQTHLIEEERAPVRRVKEPGLGVASVRERAPLEAEQLGLEQGFRDRRAVDVHKGAAPPGPQTMHEPGDQPLAGAGLALDQDRGQAPARRLAFQELAQLPPDDVDGRALSEQFRQPFHSRG
jgi:hypothetical protein